MSQIAADPSGQALSSKLAQAAELVGAGVSLSEAARRVGLNRATLTRARHRPEFVSAVNRRRAELLAAVRNRLLQAAERAATVLADALDSDEEKVRVRTAEIVLRGLRLLGSSPPAIGSTAPQAAYEQDTELDRLLRELNGA